MFENVLVAFVPLLCVAATPVHQTYIPIAQDVELRKEFGDSVTSIGSYYIVEGSKEGVNVTLATEKNKRLRLVFECTERDSGVSIRSAPNGCSWTVICYGHISVINWMLNVRVDDTTFGFPVTQKRLELSVCENDVVQDGRGPFRPACTLGPTDVNSTTRIWNLSFSRNRKLPNAPVLLVYV
ncbi:hypothetical protein AAVH_33984, partial [Aphelenchoides avenae]